MNPASSLSFRATVRRETSDGSVSRGAFAAMRIIPGQRRWGESSVLCRCNLTCISQSPIHKKHLFYDGIRNFPDAMTSGPYKEHH